MRENDQSRSNIYMKLVLALAATLSLTAACEVAGDTESSVAAIEGDECGSGSGDYAGSSWDGPYNCIDDQCHHAANCGVDDGATGIVSCTGAQDGPYGHTINYTVGENGEVCLSEPQNGASCCFSTSISPSGEPDLSVDEAMDCLSQLCGDQYTGEQDPLDPGEQWDNDYLDCVENNPADSTSCEACCDANANNVGPNWPPDMQQQAEEYRARCKEACTSFDFDCGGGVSIHEEYVCDGSLDCPNGSDEAGCGGGSGSGY